MKIDELDEYQLLTREMVDSYLNHKGWCNLPDPEIRLLKPSYVQITFSMGLVRAVEQIAEIEGRTVQALLREINPRMRDGWPSDAALDKQGQWVIWVETVGAFTIWDTDTVWERKQRAPNAEVRCWPCDDNGNKVRWYVDDAGNPL